MSMKPVKRGRIPEHKHCTICGKSMPVDADFCSDECKDTYLRRVRRDRRSRLLFLLFYAVILAALFFFLFWTGS